MEAGGKAGMKQSKIIGITGGIATGKSTAVEYLKSKGYPIIDSDQIAHKVLESPMILKNIKTIMIDLDDEYDDDEFIYIRSISPNKIEYCVSNSEKIKKEEYIEEPKVIDLSNE